MEDNGSKLMPAGGDAATATEPKKADIPDSPRKRKKTPCGCAARRLCYTGMKIMRRARYISRRVHALESLILLILGAARKRLVYSMRLFFVRNGVSFEFVEDMIISLRRGSAAAKKRGVLHVIGYWLMVAAALVMRGVARLFSSINYIAPLLAVTVFVTVIAGTLHMTFALRVYYNGEEIGYIADESVFENAEKQMLGRIVFEDYIKPDNAVPQFTIAAVKKDSLLDEDRLTDELIMASGNELSQATGLYVEEKFIGAVPKRAELTTLLSSIKDRYRTADDLNESDERVEFVKNVEARDGLYPVSSVVDIGHMTDILNTEEEAERVYITVAGDAPITIAQKNGVPYSQIKALNPDIEKSLLVGQEVLVKKPVPVLEVKVVRTETTEEEVNFKIEQIQDTNQYQGYVKITQRGQKGKAVVTSEVTYIDGMETDRTVLDTRVVKEPVNEKVVVGGKFPLKQLPTSNNASGSFIWPVAGGYVSCGINGYWGHTGMDIASGTGTAIYASASGIVTKAAYNTTGYGYHIIINHGGGVETLYGHNSKLYVKVGDWVNQGQLIAAMGRTGRATGPHCHFEVRINGRYMNPANYIGTRSPY